jgi:sugar phosphate isomerase/epimerase
VGADGQGPVTRLGVLSSALPDLPPQRLCAVAAAAGLSGIEWAVGPGHPVDLADPGAAVAGLRAAATGYGLECAGLAVQDDTALATLQPGAWQELAVAGAALGAPHVRVFAPPSPAVTPAESAGGAAELRAALGRCAPEVARHGLRLLLEPAPGTAAPGPSLARWALSGADPDAVGAVYDPGSLAQEGWVQPVVAVAVLGALLRHVHVKNVAPGREAGAWRWRPAALEEGFVDWVRVLAALRAAGYDGWLVLDHLSGPAGTAAVAADVLAADVAGVRRLVGMVAP